MTDAQFCWSPANWCNVGPLLPDLLLFQCWLMYCWSSGDWCTAGPLLTDVPLVLCLLMYCWSSANLCTAGPLLTDAQYCWSSANWCTAGPLLTDVQYSWSYVDWCTAGPLLPAALTVCHWLTQCSLFLLKLPGIFTEISVKNSKCTERFTKYSALIFSV